MKDLPPPYRCRIQRAKALPAACPVCGASTAHAWPLADSYAMMKAVYGHPCHIYCSAVEGWPGFVAWHFICAHEPPMATAMRTNRFFEFLERESGTEFKGGHYTIPFNRD